MDKATLYAIGSAIFAALTALFAKIGVESIDSNLATWIRTIVILVFTSAIVWHQKLFVSEISNKSLIFLIISGICTGASWLLYFKALQLGEISKIAPIDKLSVAITILLSFVIFNEPLNPKTLIGGALVSLGVFIIAF